MDFKQAIAAGVVGCSSLAASAAEYSTALAEEPSGTYSAGYSRTSIPTGSFADSYSLTGAADGLYDVLVTFSGLNMSLSGFSLNGLLPTEVFDSSRFVFRAIEVRNNLSNPIVLSLSGSANSSAALYSGEISITAVPEPGFIAAFLAGGGFLALVAVRNRRAGCDTH